MLKLDLYIFGGRGASSGVSDKGHKYGTDYKTIFQSGNIKFVVKARKDAEELEETMTKGRVYVLMNNKNEPGYIIYFNNELKRNRRIDIKSFHKGMKPHNHHFEEQIEMNGKKGASKLDIKESKMVDRVNNLWNKRIKK